MLFKELNIIDPILKALQDEKYSEPTPIQAKAIPHILNHEDLMGCAQTGTGKTAAFAIPILQHLHGDGRPTKGYRKIRALILTPTRELAIQIGENFATYGRYLKLKHAVIFGGVSQSRQENELRGGADILVATPGRLLDMMAQNIIKLNDVQHFVLDEADRMLDMGFIHDIKKVLTKLPAQRQSLFFSATMPKNIEELSQTILTNPKKVAVNPVSSTAETIQQKIYYTNRMDKRSLLLHILEDEAMQQVLVFARTKHGSDKIVTFLKKKKIAAAAIHGDKAQNHRQRSLKQFKEGEIRVLVATDIAARGIDIDKLFYVINYDIPNVAETYVHRIGRVGRAGESGIAIAICEPEENAYIRDIEKLTGKKIERVDDNPFPQTEKPMTEGERKEFEKEKQRRKQEFFANRNKKRNQAGNAGQGQRPKQSKSGGKRNFKK